MDTHASFVPLIALPFVRGYEAFRDALDRTLHVVLAAREEINPTPQDPTRWHRRQMTLPVKTIEGLRATYVWRRQRPDGKWEYTRRDMTEEEAEAEHDLSVW